METPYTEEERSENKRKKKRGLFGRRKDKKEKKEKKKKEDFDASEDMYYGIQLKPIDEYTRSFDATGEISREDEGFKKLFDENTAELDDEVAKDFERLQRERRRRVAEAVENAGVDIDEVENELGIVAPVPVSGLRATRTRSSTASRWNPARARTTCRSSRRPCCRTRRRARWRSSSTWTATRSASSRRRSCRRSARTRCAGFSRTVQEAPEDAPPVREDMEEISSVRVASEEPEAEEPIGEFDDVSSFSEEKRAEMEEAQPQEADGEAPEGAPEAAAPARRRGRSGPRAAGQDLRAGQRRDGIQKARPAGAHHQRGRAAERPAQRGAHLFGGQQYVRGGRCAPLKIRFATRMRRKPRRRRAAENSDEHSTTYTGPADAKSVSHDLRTTMRELTIRMLVTGVSTAVLLLASFIAESGFSPNHDGYRRCIGYTIVSLVLLLVAVGFCAKSLLNGLRALLQFRANSDSAAAVAAAAVLIQTICTLFSSSALATGQVHLYAGIAAGILFLNSLGKLTMIRRIHSNFRFVASREQKYTVRIFDDYNTSLKLAGSSVVSQPTIAYQQKAGFLKRFLQISYEPDPAETASQMLAPVGLVASLLLCVVALVITKDASLAITALAASCCVCVAVTNMLAVNLPISRLSHRMRRARRDGLGL